MEISPRQIDDEAIQRCSDTSRISGGYASYGRYGGELFFKMWEFLMRR